MQVFQLDVKSAFLNKELQEKIYVEQPLGYVLKGKKDDVYKLYKALYGLKQTLKAWNNKIDLYFHQNEFERCHSEPTFYVKRRGTTSSMDCFYVYDLIYASWNEDIVEEFIKKEMMKEYEMTDLGLMKNSVWQVVNQ